MSYSMTINHQSRQVLIDLSKHDVVIKQGVRRGLYFAGKQLIRTASKGIIKPPKTGKYYKYKGRRIRASAQGEYPSNRSGLLRRGLGFDVKGFEELEFGDTTAYAGYVELKKGNKGGRPYLKKSVEKNKDVVLNLIADNINKELGL